MNIFSVAWCLVLADHAEAFSLRTSLTTRSALHAKRGNKSAKQKASSNSSTGFGFSSATVPIAAGDDDYAIFPRLEPNILKTLVPSAPLLLETPGDLNQEIVQRLGQIYGFRNFNCDASTLQQRQPVPTSPLSDMMALDGGVAATDLLSTYTQAKDLTDLIKSATTTTSSTTSDPVLDSPSSPTVDLGLGRLPKFSKIRVLHIDPLVLAIDGFFTNEECDRYVAKSSSNDNLLLQSRSPTVGKDALAKAQRTSTTWYHHYQGVPELMAKASRLLGLDTIDHWEEPQTVRYRRTERFTWHLDALGPAENQRKLGGQRIATLLVYLTELDEKDGGATMFRDLGVDNTPLRVQPQKGSALLFFPAAGGIADAPFDIRTLHCGEAVSASAVHDKWIAQMWLRDGRYKPTAPPGNNHAASYEAIAAYVGSVGKS